MDKSISQFREVSKANGEEYVLLSYPNITNVKIKVKNLLADTENTDDHEHIEDAPSDSKLYGRKNKQWSEINIPNVSNFVTEYLFQLKLDTKQDKGDYATRLELIDRLDSKQPIGDYAVKSDIPDVSDFITDNDLLTGLKTKQDAGDYATRIELKQGLSLKLPTGDYATRAGLPDITPFVTTSVDNLANYYLKSLTYTKALVNELINSISSISFLIVDNLPETGESGTIYLVASGEIAENNWYNEFIYVNLAWELIGTTQIDLTNYYTKNEINDNFVTKAEMPDVSQFATKLELNNYVLKSYVSYLELMAKDVTREEQIRIADENVRKQNETERQASEESRISLEVKRDSAEQLRSSAEQTRIEAETVRELNEQNRLTVEQQRVNEFNELKQLSETATNNANEAVQAANTAAENANSAASDINKKIMS